MHPVVVLIFHQPVDDRANRLGAALAAARLEVATHHAAAFRRLGATRVELIAERSTESFGRRLRRTIDRVRVPGDAGLVVLGSGAAAAARTADLRPFVEVAAGRLPGTPALANNRYSADLVAVASTDLVRNVPDLPVDNLVPRWLADVAAVPVADLRSRWRVQVDLDSPIDLLLVGGAAARSLGPDDSECAAARLAGIRERLADPRSEILVSGRTSARALSWLERSSACRVRAWVEERGLRAAHPVDGANGANRRAPSSVLGLHLDRQGPDGLGRVVASMADGALIDSRVLLAHRLGSDESTWPDPEDRHASDLLLAGRIHDPWLRALTASARDAPVPILLGGHSLVGPGVHLLGRHQGGRP